MCNETYPINNEAEEKQIPQEFEYKLDNMQSVPKHGWIEYFS